MDPDESANTAEDGTVDVPCCVATELHAAVMARNTTAAIARIVRTNHLRRKKRPARLFVPAAGAVASLAWRAAFVFNELLGVRAVTRFRRRNRYRFEGRRFLREIEDIANRVSAYVGRPERRRSKVLLDELQEAAELVLRLRDVVFLRIRRDNDQRNAIA